MSVQEQGIMPMYMMDPSLSTSSTSMQAMLLNHMPMLDHALNMHGASVYFNNAAGPCMPQIGVSGGDDGLYGGQGMIGGVNVGIEGELHVPPLESISIEETAKTEYTYDNNTGKYPCNNKNIKAENNIVAGVGNVWQGEELNVGEWDLEELMKDVSSFPSLDFRVE